MTGRYLETYFTPKVHAARQQYYGWSQNTPSLPEQERAFIETSDSFCIPVILENGWPYVRHRCGKPDFLSVVSPHNSPWPTHGQLADARDCQPRC